MYNQKLIHLSDKKVWAKPQTKLEALIADFWLSAPSSTYLLLINSTNSKTTKPTIVTTQGNNDLGSVADSVAVFVLTILLESDCANYCNIVAKNGDHLEILKEDIIEQMALPRNPLDNLSRNIIEDMITSFSIVYSNGRINCDCPKCQTKFRDVIVKPLLLKRGWTDKTETKPRKQPIGDLIKSIFTDVKPQQQQQQQQPPEPPTQNTQRIW